MPQMQLPIFAPGLNLINQQVGYEKRDGQVYYFLGQLPLYTHAEKDVRAFRLITSQLVVNAQVKQSEIVRAFGVPPISVKRSTKCLREEGIEGFYKRREGSKPHVFTPQVTEQAQRLLDQGKTASEVARRLNLKADTVRKVIQAGRLKKNSRPTGKTRQR